MAGVSTTFCSRSFHPIRCDFIAVFSGRTAFATALVRAHKLRFLTTASLETFYESNGQGGLSWPSEFEPIGSMHRAPSAANNERRADVSMRQSEIPTEPLIKRRMTLSFNQGLFRQTCHSTCIEPAIGFPLSEWRALFQLRCFAHAHACAGRKTVGRTSCG
jgi:hypothetical protein